MTSTSIEATPITEAEQKRRAEYVKGLRALADVLEANPAVELPYAGSGTELTISLLSVADPRTAMANAARAFPIKWDKNAWGPAGTAYFSLRGSLHGLRMEICAYREAVCERVVTGTQEVTKTVKDPEALAAVPEIEVTETIDTVEWRCGSILAPSAPAQVEDAA
jgi:hypothetical protein